MASLRRLSRLILPLRPGPVPAAMRRCRRRPWRQPVRRWSRGRQGCFDACMPAADDDYVVVLYAGCHVPRGTCKIPGLGKGRRSASENSWLSPARVQLVIKSVGTNSARTCRQAPQGTIGVSVSATITRATKSFSPWSIALPTQTRSAHIVRPKEMFSTLLPEIIRPDFSRSAAPTRKFEYGA